MRSASGFAYRLHDHEVDDLGLLEYPALASNLDV